MSSTIFNSINVIYVINLYLKMFPIIYSYFAMKNNMDILLLEKFEIPIRILYKKEKLLYNKKLILNKNTNFLLGRKSFLMNHV